MDLKRQNKWTLWTEKRNDYGILFRGYKITPITFGMDLDLRMLEQWTESAKTWTTQEDLTFKKL